MTIPTPDRMKETTLTNDVFCIKVVTADRKSEYEPFHRMLSPKLEADLDAGRIAGVDFFRDNNKYCPRRLADAGLMGCTLTYRKCRTVVSPFYNSVGICSYYYGNHMPGPEEVEEVREMNSHTNKPLLAIVLRIPAGTKVRFDNFNGRLVKWGTVMTEFAEVIS